MEEIQFLNYILSIMAVLLAGASLRMMFKHQEHHDREVKDLRDKIRQLVEASQPKKR
jgi:hypothetical protein